MDTLITHVIITVTVRSVPTLLHYILPLAFYLSGPSWIEKLDDFVLDCLLYVLSIQIKPIQPRSDPVIQTNNTYDPQASENLLIPQISTVV